MSETTTSVTAWPAIETVTSGSMKVIEGVVTTGGKVNRPEAELLANIRYAIRQQHPQAKVQGVQPDRVALVGSGPSLLDTEQELVDLLREGVKLVTVNGAYNWCLSKHLIPSAQIVMDARPGNVRFLEPAIPRCAYLLASQCDPSLWDAVKGRENVWIFHAMNTDNPHKHILDEFYKGRWTGVGGGTTVMTRGIGLLRMIGYCRFDLFGADSCWLHGQHHAFDQPENAQDKRYALKVSLPEHPEMHRTFFCSPWHIKQLEDLLQVIRMVGSQFFLNIHGDGLLAYALQLHAYGADLDIEQTEVPADAVAEG